METNLKCDKCGGNIMKMEENSMNCESCGVAMATKDGENSERENE
ncbi:MAG: hypothetical protein ABIR14_01625 [Candidatus Paceibacterota bacterium]